MRESDSTHIFCLLSDLPRVVACTSWSDTGLHSLMHYGRTRVACTSWVGQRDERHVVVDQLPKTGRRLAECHVEQVLLREVHLHLLTVINSGMQKRRMSWRHVRGAIGQCPRVLAVSSHPSDGRDQSARYEVPPVTEPRPQSAGAINETSAMESHSTTLTWEKDL